MSEANCTGQIRYTPKFGVYQSILQCDKGDLFQEYSGDTSSPVVTPDFASMQPKLSMIIISSRVAEGVVVPSSVKWYFNGTELTFTGNISTNVFNGETGHFKIIPYQAGVNDYFSLQILKNLVVAGGFAASMIKCIATVAVSNTSDTIQSTYPIAINKGVGNAKRITIIAGDNKFFTITTKGGTCALKAMAYLGGVEITSNLTYKWYKLVAGIWTLTVWTSQLVDIADTEIDTAGVFKVEIYQNGVLIGSDTTTVMDASDPFDIILNPTPEDESISSQGDTVVYAPILVKRGSTTKYKDMLFYFAFMDSVGNVLNPSTANVAAATGTCTYDMCLQAGGNVNYLITTEE